MPAISTSLLCFSRFELKVLFLLVLLLCCSKINRTGSCFCQLSVALLNFFSALCVSSSCHFQRLSLIFEATLLFLELAVRNPHLFLPSE